MAEITFTYTPDYDQADTDVTLVEPAVIHTLTLPKNISVSNGLTIEDINYHYNLWLRGLGYRQLDID